jgi:hypothetical protein
MDTIRAALGFRTKEGIFICGKHSYDEAVKKYILSGNYNVKGANPKYNTECENPKESIEVQNKIGSENLYNYPLYKTEDLNALKILFKKLDFIKFIKMKNIHPINKCRNWVRDKGITIKEKEIPFCKVKLKPEFEEFLTRMLILLDTVEDKGDVNIFNIMKTELMKYCKTIKKNNTYIFDDLLNSLDKNIRSFYLDEESLEITNEDLYKTISKQYLEEKVGNSFRMFAKFMLAAYNFNGPMGDVANFIVAMCYPGGNGCRGGNGCIDANTLNISAAVTSGYSIKNVNLPSLINDIFINQNYSLIKYVPDVIILDAELDDLLAVGVINYIRDNMGKKEGVKIMLQYNQENEEKVNKIIEDSNLINITKIVNNDVDKSKIYKHVNNGPNPWSLLNYNKSIKGISFYNYLIPLCSATLIYLYYTIRY